MPENSTPLTPEDIEQIARRVAARHSRRASAGAGTPAGAQEGASSGLPQIDRMEPPPGIASPPAGARAASAVLAVPDSQRERFAAAGRFRSPRRPRDGRERAPAVPQPEPPERPERPASVPYAPQDSKQDALWFVESYRRMLADLRIRVEELEEDLRPYLALSAKRRQKAETYAQYEQLVGKLGAIDAQAALGLPDLSESLRATLEALRSEGLDELTRARQNMEAAKSDAARLGAGAEEIDAASGAAEAQAETPDGIETVSAPRDPEKLNKWLMAKVIGRAAFGVLAWAQGLAIPYTLEQYRKQLVAHRKAGEDVEAILSEMEAAITPEMRRAAREGAWFIPVAEQKVTELRAKVDKLVADDQITPKRRDQILGELGVITMKYAKEETPARERYLKDSAQALGDYLEKTVSKTQLLRAGLDTSLFITGNFFARGLTYFGFAPVERALKQKREYELDLRARVLMEGQEYTPEFAEKIKEIWKRTVTDGIKEFLRSAAGKGATVERETSRWCRFIDRVRAYATLARAFGIASAATTDWGRLDVREGAEEFLKAWEQKGPVALYESFVKGTARVYHIELEGERGHETIKVPIKLEPSAPEVPPEPIEPPSEPIEPPGPTLTESNGVIRSLVDGGKAELHGNELAIHIGDGDKETGFAEVQQALRRVVGQEIKLPTDHLRDVDADRIEKITKLLTHVLRGEKLPAFMFEKGADIPAPHSWNDIVDWTREGDLVIKDYTRFENELMPKLEELADNYKWSGLAYINNTGHRVWQQEIADARAVEGQRIIADDFDKSPAVHQAEVAVAKYEGEVGSGIHGAEVVAAEVVDEDTYPIHADKDVIPVEDGKVDHVIVERDGQPFSYKIASPIDMSQPYASGDILTALTAARQATETTGAEAVSGTPEAPEAPESPKEPEAPRAPALRTPADLARPVSEGGLVGADGRLHFGALEIKVGWYEKWDDQTVERFVKDAPGKYDPYRWFSDEADAHFKLARAMGEHEAPERMEVGKWILENYKKIGEWVR